MPDVYYYCGDKDVPLRENHRFTRWLRNTDALEHWREHFLNKNIATAIGRLGSSYALYIENEMIIK